MVADLMPGQSKRIITLPMALPHQREVLTSPARFKVVACGRRWGKTTVGLLAGVKGHGPHRGALRGAVDGANIWWVAPTFTVASIIWRHLKRATKEAWVSKSETERRIELPGGGSVSVKSADNPDSLRGEGLDGLLVDEAAFVAPGVWREALRPALSDRQGWGVFFSTPNGMNWFYDLFRLAGSENGWARWQRPTADNFVVPPHEIEAAKNEVGLRAFAQEYLAQFTDMEGAEFQGSYFGEQIWFDQFPPDDRVRLRVMALDPSLGKTDKSDYSAIVMLTLDIDGRMWIDADIERRDSSETARRCVELGRMFNPRGFAIEANQFQTLLASNIWEQSRAIGISLPIREIINHLPKLTRIRSLTPYLSRGEIRFRRGSRGAQLLVEQLRSFPVADHDDGPDALAMAVDEARRLLAGGDGNDQPERIEYLPL